MNEDIFHLGIKAIIRNSEGKILLLKTNPAKLKGYNGEPYWDVPGGRIQKGSSVADTLRREVEEETGVKEIKSFEPFSMVLSNIRIPTNDGSFGLILSSYVCEVETVGEIRLSDEHIEYNWFTPKEAAQLLTVKYPKEFVSKIAELD